MTGLSGRKHMSRLIGPWRKVNELHLQVTTDCNLKCRYCYDANSRPREGRGLMSEQVARCAITEVLLQSNAPSIMLVFHGGEPLLQPINFYDHLCNYARTQVATTGRSISFGMQTNMTLLTDEKASVFARYGVSLGTSIDGPQNIHDAFRGAHAEVLRGVSMARRHGILSGAIVVIQEHNCHRMPEVLSHLLELGFASTWCNVGAAVGRGLNAIRPLTTMEILEATCQVFEFMAAHNFALTEQRVLNKVERFLFKRHSRSLNLLSCQTPFCHAGTSMVAVDVDGGVYPCGCAVTDGNMSSFRLASIGDPKSFDRNRLISFHAKSDKYRSLCPDCSARFVCDHGCPAFDAHDPKTADSTCAANKKFHKYLMDNSKTLNRYKAFFHERGIT